MKFGQFLIFVGILLIVTGILITLIGKLPFGKLPGDIVYEKPNLKIYFPITTSIILSIVLTLILNFLIWILKK